MSETTIAIANLTNQTTALLTEVTVQQGQVVAAATTQAQLAAASATTAATSATAATADANAADAARILAEAAESAANTSALNAAAVVTGGTATVAPQAGKIPLADSEGNIADGWLSPESKAMGKSEFFALAEKRIRDSAGSGFAEWGKHYSTWGETINSGLYAPPTAANKPNSIYLGSDGSNPQGSSRVNTPLTQVNGVISTLGKISSSSNDLLSRLRFPPAPDGTKTYDSATGAVVTHASAAEAFGGVVGVDGSFVNGQGNWVINGNASVNIIGGVATITTTNYTAIFITSPVELGISYRLTATVKAGSSTPRIYIGTSGNWGEYYNSQQLPDGEVSFDFITSTTDLSVRLSTSDQSGTCEFSNISVMPVTESVVTSRQDFGFLESFHEKISDKDVVYPLGNVQYGTTTWEGISLATSVVAQGYSAFGDWDTATTGRGVVWSTLSAANKAKFIEDPENNIYSDGDDLIQVRYRVRVVEGVNDNWENASDTLSLLICNTGSATRYVSPRGYRDGAQGDLTTGAGNNSFAQSGTLGNWKTLRTNTAHNGLCFAVPLFLVQRRNQGAYHPVFNSEGTAALRYADGTGSNAWYNGSVVNIRSKGDCFKVGNIGYAGTGNTTGAAFANKGNIATSSFRPDSKFYDAIYASDVQDLRMSSKSLPLAELREKSKRMAIAGEVRGFEAVPFTVAYTSPDTAYAGNWNTLLADPTKPLVGSVGDIIFVELSDGSFHKAEISAVSVVAHRYSFTPTTTGPKSNNPVGIIETKQTHKQANPTWTDIIGSPANIAATFPNGVEGQWVPQIPDGTQIEYSFNRKSLGSDVSSTYSLDNGITWTNTSRTRNFLKNSYTYYAEANRVDLFNYETQAHFTEDAVNSKVLDLGDVYATNHYYPSQGSEMVSTLLNKVATEGSFPRFVARSVDNTVIDINGKILLSNAETLTHTTISLGSSSLGGAAVKALDYLSSENNVAKLCYAYKEMVYDVDWGDNNQFEITNNQTTQTDDNGNTVKYGTASFNTQYFVVEE